MIGIFPVATIKIPKKRAEKKKEGWRYYDLGLCEIQHVSVEQGIATMKQALEMGEPWAAKTLANYYTSDGYDLPRGKVTYNEANLLEAIEYEKVALELMSQPSYPGNDLDHLIGEEEKQYHLHIASSLATSYIGLFIITIKSHRNSIDNNIGEATVEALREARKAAENCIKIPYKREIWPRSVYEKNKKRCEVIKEIAKKLIPREKNRLLMASSVACRGIILSSCEAHIEIEREMLGLYNVYKEASEKLLAAL